MPTTTFEDGDGVGEGEFDGKVAHLVGGVACRWLNVLEADDVDGEVVSCAS